MLCNSTCACCGILYQMSADCSIINSSLNCWLIMDVKKIGKYIDSLLFFWKLYDFKTKDSNTYYKVEYFVWMFYNLPGLSKVGCRCKVHSELQFAIDSSKRTMYSSLRNNHFEWNKRVCWYDLFLNVYSELWSTFLKVALLAKLCCRLLNKCPK